MRDSYLGLALWIAVVLGGCVNAGDAPVLGGDVVADVTVVADGALDGTAPDASTDDISNEDAVIVSDAALTDASPDASADSDGSSDAVPDAIPDVSPDGTPDVSPDAEGDTQETDTGVPQCAQDADCSGDLEPCQVLTCQDGQCVLGYAEPVDKVLCDDGVACTKEDVCLEGGLCVGKPDHSECDDGQDCTTDTCEPDAESTCQNVAEADGNGCSDDNACTIDDQCLSGACVGLGKSCDDDKPCTADSCELPSGECVNSPLSVNSPCDAGNKCTTEDFCDEVGECTQGDPVIPEDCKDDNPCTVDGCEPSLSQFGGKCTNVTLPDSTNCEDGDPCTNVAVCLGGTCQGTVLDNPTADQSQPPFCDDSNECTTSSCVEFEGCQHLPLATGAFCTDGDACTEGDSCKSGTCVPGDPLECPEPTTCLGSSCDSAVGCVTDEVELGTGCELDDFDGVCSLAQCDGSGGCGVFLHGTTLSDASGRFSDAQALPDGGWVLVGSVESEDPGLSSTCALVTRLGYDTEVLWQFTPTCDGSPVASPSSAHAVEVFPNGSFAVVGVAHTGPGEDEVEARLWVVGSDGTSVSTHEIGNPNAKGPAWDVRVLDDQNLLVLLDEPIADGEASRAVVRRYTSSGDWATGETSSDWMFEQTENQVPAQSIDARTLFDVQAEESVFGLLGTFILSGQNTKQLVTNFSLATLPDDIPAQVTYSESGPDGLIPLQASHGLYWPAAPGGGSFVAVGSAVYGGDTWSQTNILNGNSKLIGAYQIKDEHNHAVARFGQDHLVVLAQHEDKGSRVHLLALKDVTADVVENDGGLDLLDTLELGDETEGFAIACHGEQLCLVAGSSDEAPAWSIFHLTDTEKLEACEP